MKEKTYIYNATISFSKQIEIKSTGDSDEEESLIQKELDKWTNSIYDKVPSDLYEDSDSFTEYYDTI